MNSRKTFTQCTSDEQLIETGVLDVSLATELLHMAEHRIAFWKKVNLEKDYPSLFLEGHYEIIKELCTALLALDGWKALNHECLFAYLKEKGKSLDLDFGYLLELKDLRNALDYRGVQVSHTIWKDNKTKIIFLIQELIKEVKKKIEK